MLKKTIALIGLTMSISANAAIIDNGLHTTDTSTGLDWLDLTENYNRSYDDISSKFGAGMEFDGYRYATLSEVTSLWVNLGVPIGAEGSIIFTAGSPGYANFETAVDLLGGFPSCGITETSVCAALGITVDPDSTSQNLIIGAGFFYPDVISLRRQQSDDGSYGGTPSVVISSYLVTTSAVPIPAAAWLFGSALLGLGALKRKTPRSALSC